MLQTLALPYDLPEGYGSAGAATCRDPMTDIDFKAIPNEEFPSDHLAMG